MMGGDAILAKNKKRNDALAIGIGIGVVIGVFQGYFTNNLVIGIGIAFLKK
ncbi:septum formation initiator [Bacillus cereus]|nr:septum formation initiator [Bacillus cereus]